MILYTPIPLEEIFPEDESEYEKQKWIEVGGRLVKVYDLQNGQYEIQQLLSTNPNDYLNQQFLPGTKWKI
jgi:hypothetical protein